MIVSQIYEFLILKYQVCCAAFGRDEKQSIEFGFCISTIASLFSNTIIFTSFNIFLLLVEKYKKMCYNISVNF